VINTHQDLLNFFLDEVQLDTAQRAKMRLRRNANRNRLDAGLVKADKPLPIRNVIQGSYAMHTMVQANVDSSDIDDGAVFKKADLVGPRGAEFTPIDAKNMVRDALDDDSFARAPEVLTNCVRVYYNDGFTVDIPVYREVESGSGTKYELASVYWKESDPDAVTLWFNTSVDQKSPDRDNGKQMRRIVRLLKAWSKSRASWNMPSGFVLSILVNERYYKNSDWYDRDDKALLTMLNSIYQRLQGNLQVYRPVTPAEQITKSSSDANMRELRDRLGDAIATLSVLLKADCTRLEALKAYKSVFATAYFDAEIARLERDEAASKAASLLTTSGGEPKAPFIKRGGEGGYA
jgi:hypothetical protein